MRDEEEIDARAVRDGEEIDVVGYGTRMVEIRCVCQMRLLYHHYGFF